MGENLQEIFSETLSGVKVSDHGDEKINNR
jgi:hypothetical protein